jgi:hypothetical protein
MRVLSALACIATLMAATATPATSQPSAPAFGQGSEGRVQLIDHRGRRKDYARGIIVVITIVTMVLTTHRMPITGRTTVLTTTPTIVPITVPA